jgi:hypothetical protein
MRLYGELSVSACFGSWLSRITCSQVGLYNPFTAEYFLQIGQSPMHSPLWNSL